MQKKFFHPMLNVKQFIHLLMRKLGIFDLNSKKDILMFYLFSRQYEGYLGNLRIKSIVDIINDRPLIGEKGRTINNTYLRARFVYNIINNFIASADFQITDEHVDDCSSSNEGTSQLVLTPQEKIVKQEKKYFLSIMISLFFSIRI